MLVKHERRPFRFGVTLLAGLLGCLSLMGCKDEKTFAVIRDGYQSELKMEAGLA